MVFGSRTNGFSIKKEKLKLKPGLGYVSTYISFFQLLSPCMSIDVLNTSKTLVRLFEGGLDGQVLVAYGESKDVLKAFDSFEFLLMPETPIIEMKKSLSQARLVLTKYPKSVSILGFVKKGMMALVDSECKGRIENPVPSHEVIDSGVPPKRPGEINRFLIGNEDNIKLILSTITDSRYLHLIFASSLVPSSLEYLRFRYSESGL